MKKPLYDVSQLEPEIDVDLDIQDFSEEEVKSRLPTFPANKLADIVITNRYIGLYKELAVEAMNELAVRRLGGDNFKYEDYIEDNLKKLPKIDFIFPQVSSLLDKVKGFKK